MVAKRKSVDGGKASSKGVSRGLVSRLRKAGKTCAPEKIWSVIQAAMGGSKVNLRAALEAARAEASSTPWRPRASIAPQSKAGAPKGSPKAHAAGKAGAKARAKAGAKSPRAAAKPLAAPSRKADKGQPDLVDLSQFNDLYDLINAWMRTKGVVKREPAEPSAEGGASTKKEPKVKLEPAINRELVNQITKVGIIDLTEGESQPRAGGKRPASGSASPSAKPTRAPSLAAIQAATAKGSSSAAPSTPLRRSISKSKLALQRSNSKAKLLAAMQKRAAAGKAKAKSKAAEAAPRNKMPQGLKSLNKLARKCDPHKLWTILQAAAHENKPSASIGAALRAARETASEAGHKPRQA